MACECRFTFNILSVGETGIGKTTLMESLFNMPLDFGQCNNELNTVELRAKSYGRIVVFMNPNSQTFVFTENMILQTSKKVVCTSS